MHPWLWLIFVAYACPILLVNSLLKKIKHLYLKFFLKQLILISILIVIFIFFNDLKLLNYQKYLQLNVKEIYWFFIGIIVGALFIFVEMITYSYFYKKHLSNISFGNKKQIIEYIDILFTAITEEIIYRLVLLTILQYLNVPISVIVLLISFCFLLNHFFILKNRFHIFSKYIFSVLLTLVTIYLGIWYFALWCHLTYNLIYIFINWQKNRKEVKNDKNGYQIK